MVNRKPAQPAAPSKEDTLAQIDALLIGSAEGKHDDIPGWAKMWHLHNLEKRIAANGEA